MTKIIPNFDSAKSSYCYGYETYSCILFLSSASHPTRTSPIEVQGLLVSAAHFHRGRRRNAMIQTFQSLLVVAAIKKQESRSALD